MRTSTTFKKGEGKKPGTTNRLTRDKKEIISSVLDNQLPKVNEVLNAMFKTEPHRAIELTLKLMEFVIPKMKAVEHSGAEGRDLFPQTIIVRDEETKNLMEKLGSKVNGNNNGI